MYRILFLDDEDVLLEALPLLLRPEGFELIATSSVNEALEHLRKGTFDAVLLDIMMPVPKDLEMDPMQLAYGCETGVAVARLMKDVKSAVPIVAFTALTDPEIRSRMREAGIQSVINKPTEISAMVDILREAIECQA